MGRLGTSTAIREHGGAIDGVVSPRQPGSALKPFTYAAAFERGGITGAGPGRRAVAVPDGRARRAVQPAQLRRPVPRPAARPRRPLPDRRTSRPSRWHHEIGVPAIARLLRRVGLTTLDHNAAHYGLGLTLGNAEVRLDELVAAYAHVRARWHVPRAADDRRDRRHAATDPQRTSASSLRARRSGSPTCSQTTRRGRMSSGAAAASSSRSRWRRRPARPSRTSTTGWSATRATSPLASGSATSTGRRSGDPSGVTGAGPIFHAVMLAAVERVRGSLPIARVVAYRRPDCRCARTGDLRDVRDARRRGVSDARDRMDRDRRPGGSLHVAPRDRPGCRHCLARAVPQVGPRVGAARRVLVAT